MSLADFINNIKELIYSVPDMQNRAIPSEQFIAIFTLLIRWIFPLLAVIIVFRCIASLLGNKPEPEVWAYLTMPDESILQITHWENILGRAGKADIILNYPSVSKLHAALTRSTDGKWYVSDLSSKGGSKINGTVVESKTHIHYNDTLELGGVEFKFLQVPVEETQEELYTRTRPGGVIKPSITLFLITLFQLLTAATLILNVPSVNGLLFAVTFGALAVVSWLYFLFMRTIRRSGLEIEFIAFFLTTLGFAATASANPTELLKQLAAFVLGLLIFMCLGFFLRDLDWAQRMRWISAFCGLGLIAATFIFAKEINGARNWLYIGNISVQPSEIAKIAFIYAGSATLDRLMAKRNLLLYIVFAGLSIGMIALMNDFGTASVYFITFVCVAFLRSGNLSAILLSGTAAGLAGFMAVMFKPYVLNRFKAWRHVWQYSSSLGYQQTRTMICAASGGLLGLGAGNGLLKYVAAADTDLVFGMLCEEWGIIIAVSAVALIISLALFTVRSSQQGRSSFYVIAACSAMCMLTFQTMLNVFGSVDILPLTGVTFPFVSNGGSSMISSWGLFAFVKAVDTRQNASFAIKLRRVRKGDIQ